jgi:hypothetical protein
LVKLTELMFTYLTEAPSGEREEVAQVIWRDYSRGARREVPAFLRPCVTGPSRSRLLTMEAKLPARQSRHLQARHLESQQQKKNRQEKNLPGDAGVSGQIR